jgi:uncharacterized iron-regulated membrane protein
MIAMCLTGVAPLVLVFTGLWVWLRKRPGEKLAAQRRLGRARHSAAPAPAEVARTLTAGAARDAYRPWSPSSGAGSD